MWSTHRWQMVHPRMGAAGILVVLILTTLPGCGPVMETTVRPEPPASVERGSIERISVVLDASRLERRQDTIDPARLKVRLDEELRSSGLFRQCRVDLADGTAAGGPDSVTVSLTRLEYIVQGTRFPPGPPLGCVCIYPLVAPLLFERDYLKLEATVEAELLVYDRSGAVAGRTYLTELATGRANFFASGESKAATALQDIAYRNFSAQVIREYLFLTR